MKLIPTLTADTATFSIDWNGNAVQFSAKRHALTPVLLKRFSEIEKDPLEISRALASILTSWDIEDVDCTDAEQLASIVPVEFQAKIVEKIGETWAGRPTSPEASQNGSGA